jgi:glycosyltransferase involved in cell wall biosynthesis
MASGLPVISSDIEGPAPYFDAEGVTTFPSENAAALSSALRTVLQRPDLASVGRANRGYIQAHLSLDAHVNRVIELFGELLARKRMRH